MTPFEDDAEELLNEIEDQGLDIDVIREFLVMFAERIQNDVLREIDMQKMRIKESERRSWDE